MQADPHSDLEVLSSRKFAERFALKPQMFAWLLGAGTSVAAGIPTGYQMIQEFRAKLFSHLSGISQREIDSADPIWQERIDEHLARHSDLPPKGDPTEYSHAFEALYETPEERRQYISKQVAKGTPSIGHRVLGSLLSSGLTPCVFTTNFDQLPETAATIAGQLLPPEQRANVAAAAIDNAERAERCLKENDWPLIAKLHGDYQSVELKNTTDELKAQDKRLRRVLTEACQRFGLIVAGYSGRDQSVMDALNEVLRSKSPFPAGIYWLCRDTESLLPAVLEFLNNAASIQGVPVRLITGCTFDELASDLADVTSLPSPLIDHIFKASNRPTPSPVQLRVDWARKAPVLRMSALRVFKLPETARRITLKQPARVVDLRQELKRAGVYATIALIDGGVAAFGRDRELLTALQARDPSLAGEIRLDPMSDSWALGLIYDALVRALSRGKPLKHRLGGRGHKLYVSDGKPDPTPEQTARRNTMLAELSNAYGSALTGKPGQIDGRFNEGVLLRLECAEDRWWCAFEPSTFVDLANETLDGEDQEPTELTAMKFQAADWRRERWAQKYNSHWSRIIDAWANILSKPTANGLVAYGLADGEGIDARFEVGTLTAWSRPAHDHHYFDRRTP
jgi:NAD-dependent SIR2 family protein deacetylase